LGKGKEHFLRRRREKVNKYLSIQKPEQGKRDLGGDMRWDDIDIMKGGN